jgi:hypothetical protein
VDPTTAVGAEEAAELPATLLAVTVTSSVWPTSVEMGVYIGAAAPLIGVQLLPAESQLSHPYAYAIGLVPTQTPVVAVSIWPI